MTAYRRVRRVGASATYTTYTTYTTYAPIRRYADTPIRRHADTPTRRYADTPIRRYALPLRLAENTGFLEAEVTSSTFLRRTENEVIKKLDLE